MLCGFLSHAGEPFQAEHKATEMMDTSTVRPTDTLVQVAEHLVRIKDWELVAEKTDTDEIIAHRVASTLNEHSAKEKGSGLLYLLRVLAMNQLILFTCLCSMVHGAQPLASVCISIIIGFFCLGRNDTALRMSLGCATMNSIVVMAAAKYLCMYCSDGHCSFTQYKYAVGYASFVAIAWGTLAGLGLNPGIASGLAIIHTDGSLESMRDILDKINPGTTTSFSLATPSLAAVGYWALLNTAAIFGFAINNKLGSKYSVLLVVSLLAVVTACFNSTEELCLGVSDLFPVTIFCCYVIGTCSLPFGRNAATKQEPVGLQRMDLVNSLYRVHLPGIAVGALAGIFIVGGRIVIQSINDCFTIFAIVVLIFILSKSSPIHQYFSASSHGSRHISPPHESVMSSDGSDERSELVAPPQKRLHSCFKLLVRDFAGQMVYHCMHQPFLPRFGVFICTFSWKRAKETSLVYAEKRNLSDEKPDVCLEEIVFWLKNILMHRIHPNVQIGTRQRRPDVMDHENIKNVFLVGTHSHIDSCGLNEDQKNKIMGYYRSVLRRYSDIYTSIEFEVSERGEISIENNDDLKDTGMDILKQYLLISAQKVVNHCFPGALPVYFWCWLKEKRDKCQQTQSSPCELLLKSHIDVDGRYMSVYPQDTFHEMINKFCDIGETFLVQSKEDSDYSPDYYIFYNIQFLIDFMKDILCVDGKKMRDRLNSEEWKTLQTEGHAPVELLEHHLRRFYTTRNMKQMYSHLSLVDQPLVRSMLQLDFIFFVGEEFYLPQLLPKYDHCSLCPDYFQEIGDVLWEYVFDFGDFDFHHEYVFFRLLARCTRHAYCEKRKVCCDWASFHAKHTGSTPVLSDSDAHQWFTISCEKRGKDGGRHNMIYLRTSENYNHKHSLELLENVRGKQSI